MRKKILLILFTLIPFTGSVTAAPPNWSATGDSFSANIVFSTLEKQIVKMPVQDGKVVGASLQRKSDQTISAEILLEMTKDQFKGVVCRVVTDLYFESMDSAKAVIKMQNTDVDSCRTDKGPVFDSMAKVAAKIGVAMMAEKIQTEVNKSVNNTIYSTVNILKKETGENVSLDYRVYTEGLSLFMFTGEKSEPSRFVRVPYESLTSPSCSEVLSARLYHSYDSGSPYKGKLYITVKNLTGKSQADYLEVKLTGESIQKPVGSGFVLPGNNFEWNGPLAGHAGKEVTVEFYSGSTLYKAFDSRCGDYKFLVPNDGDLYVVIER